MNDTLRFCKSCEKNRVFKYNRVVGHSECRYCGCRFASEFSEKREIAYDIIEKLKGRKDKMSNDKHNNYRKEEINYIIKNILKKIK